MKIVFEAITVFADPSVEFGLQFNLTEGASDSEDDRDQEGDQPNEPAEVTEMPLAETPPATKATKNPPRPAMVPKSSRWISFERNPDLGQGRRISAGVATLRLFTICPIDI